MLSYMTIPPHQQQKPRVMPTSTNVVVADAEVVEVAGSHMLDEAQVLLHDTRAYCVFNTVTGPNMIMKAKINFKPEDWNKLTAEQKT
jgi:hypothetical protein